MSEEAMGSVGEHSSLNDDPGISMTGLNFTASAPPDEADQEYYEIRIDSICVQGAQTYDLTHNAGGIPGSII